MNKDQRKYLTEWVNKGFTEERDRIKDRRYEQPSLNNYLVAQAMAKTLKVRPAQEIAEYIQDRVLHSGKEAAIVTPKDTRSWYYGSDDQPLVKAGKHIITLEAERLFEIPEDYAERVAAWEKNEQEVAEELKRLEGVRDTVLLKVNIGSDKALESVIAQADSLASLDLVNRQLSSGMPAQLEGQK